MTYHILTETGQIVARSSVQRVTNLEKELQETKDRFKAYDEAVNTRLKHSNNIFDGDLPDKEHWKEFQNDEVFTEEFQKYYGNDSIKEADDQPQEGLEANYDTYLNMELVLPRNDNGIEFAKVTKRLKDANGIAIGRANEDFPALDSRVYEVEYPDGYKAAMSANEIAENLFAQVDDEGHRYVLFKAILDHRQDSNAINKNNAFIKSSSGGRRRIETTKGWSLLVEWKDGSTTWENLKDMKESYPVQIADYAIASNISNEAAFAWWIPHVIKKRDRIISKVKSKYWTRTHKFGIKIPKNVEEAKRFDTENKNKLWWDSIVKEMKNVRIAFEEFDGTEDEIPDDFQHVDCHLIFDVKFAENFRRKARMVGGGHQTVTPAALTYASVVSRDSVRIILMIAALLELKVMACDIQNAYLTASCREKIWTTAGPEFGIEQGKIMIITRALYGLKSSGAAFRSHLAERLYKMGYIPSRADNDVWMKPAVRKDGLEYYEYVLCYVDDILSISENPTRATDGIKATFKLKDDKVAEPEIYLGAELSKLTNVDGVECWGLSSDKYVQAAVKNVEQTLLKQSLRLPSKCVTPLKSGYKPELDATPELKSDGVQFYQELIGSLRWAIEIGRIDVLYEVALMSTYSAMPRRGHLEQVLHIFGYLKINRKFRILLDSSTPQLNPNIFKTYDWEAFYRGAKEDIPLDRPKERGKPVTISMFVDSSHGDDTKTRKIQTGILIFVNKAPVHWYSKRQPGVESSTFGAEFCAMRIGVEMIKALRYKLRMFGIPIEGAASVFCDNEAVYKNTVLPESTLNKKHHSIAYHLCREAVASKIIQVAKEGTDTNLSDLFTKTLTAARREFLLERFTY